MLLGICSFDQVEMNVVIFFILQVPIIFSRDGSCYGLGHVESLLGYVQQTPSSDTPRALRICQYQGKAVYHHMLEIECDPGETEIDFFGYVH